MAVCYRDALAAEVRAAIARAGRKQGEVASAAGLSPKTISRKLRGGGALSAEELIALADALGSDAGAWVNAAREVEDGAA